MCRLLGGYVGVFTDKYMSILVAKIPAVTAPAVMTALAQSAKLLTAKLAPAKVNVFCYILLVAYNVLTCGVTARFRPRFESIVEWVTTRSSANHILGCTCGSNCKC